MRLFLAGDVNIARAIDLLLPFPSDASMLEGRSSPDAQLERLRTKFGPVASPLDPAEVWGECLSDLRVRAPDLRLANLETAVTTVNDLQPKSISLRMNPANLPFLEPLALDFCSIANNHTMDWGREGLLETRRAVTEAGIATSGAGANLAEAQRPAIFTRPDGGRLLVFSMTSFNAGSFMSWRATESDAGQWVVAHFSEQTTAEVLEVIRRHRQNGDMVVLSIHWGQNWGSSIHESLRGFAHALIDAGEVDLIHGHSSHHVKPIEVYRGRLILYGCGDFMTDFASGFGGSPREAYRVATYRPELELGYFADVAESGELTSLVMTPFLLDRLHLQRASRDDADWLAAMLTREGQALGTGVKLLADGTLSLRW